MPAPYRRGIKRRFCEVLSDVCLPVCLSRTSGLERLKLAHG